jgi:hypothetical protein
MARVIATKQDRVFLVETRTVNGLRHGRVYDQDTDTLHPELPVASIAARGYWREVEPDDYADLAPNLSARLRSRRAKESEWVT